MNSITPFNVKYPLNILDYSSGKVNLKERKKRKRIFRRNIYYYLYEEVRNPFMKKKLDEYLKKTNEVLEYINEKYPLLKPLNISLFGSALFLEDPSDFDFLAITQGNSFLQEELRSNCKDKKKAGISIKGVNNFVYGLSQENSKNSRKRLDRIVDRTATALFRRNLPLWGYDFVNNEKPFLENLLAQASDILDNTFHLYYSPYTEKITKNKRSRKILSRIYQATTYLSFLDGNRDINDLQKRTYQSMAKGSSLSNSKSLFREAVCFYENIYRRLDKHDK